MDRLMTPRQWIDFTIGLIDRLERQLSPSAPKTARVQLAAVRVQASRSNTARARKSCEQRLDKLTESTPHFRGAARRVVGELADIAIDEAERYMESMSGLARVKGKKSAARVIEESLADFRKKRRKPIYKPIQAMSRMRDKHPHRRS
jgi:hypothetical protein